MIVAKLFGDMLSGIGNRFFEVARFTWLASIAAGIAYQGIALAFKNQGFSMTDFGTGMALMLAGGGIGTAAKDMANPANRVPKAPPDPGSAP